MMITYLHVQFLQAKKAEIQSRQNEVPRQNDTMRMGAMIPPGRPNAASMMDDRPRVSLNM